jgi:peroxiredoxin
MRADVLCLLLLTLVAPPAAAQITIEPDRPVQGGVFTVVADPAAARLESERFTRNDQLYAYLVSLQDGVFQTAWFPLTWEGSRFVGRGQVPRNALQVTVYLRTAERALSVRAVFTPRTAAGAAPAGALLPAMAFGGEPSANRRSEIEQELARSGHLGWPYQFAWRIVFLRNREMSREELLAQMASLERDTPRTSGLLYSLVDGYFMAGERDKAVATLRELCQRFPNSPQVVYALTDIADAHATRYGWNEVKDEIRTLYAAVVNAAPINPAIWREGSISMLSNPKVALADLRKVHRAWKADDPRSFEADFVLAGTLARTGANAEAEAAVSKAIEIGLQPRPAVTGTDYRPSAFRLRSGLRVQRGDLGGALSDITMAQMFARSSDWTDVETEAVLWRRLGFPGKAEAAAIKAYANGSFTAEAILKELHAGAGRAEPFDDYFRRQLEEREGIVQDARPLPAFTTATLDGVAVDSKTLKGQVTVVLFWFIGCPGMTETLPAVRRVAEEFKGRVRFLSFADNTADRLRAFLKESAFGYEVVPDSQEIIRSFGMRAVPHHAVIGEDGRLIWESGLRPEETADRLRAVIQRTLSRGAR